MAWRLILGQIALIVDLRQRIVDAKGAHKWRRGFCCRLIVEEKDSLRLYRLLKVN